MNDTTASYGASVRERVGALLAERRDYRQELVERTRPYRFVVLYGCGSIFREIVSSWNAHVQRPIDFCCDSDSAKWGQDFCGLACISTDELTSLAGQCAVFVTIGDFQPVATMLQSRGAPFVDVIHKNALDIADFLSVTPAEEIVARLGSVAELLSDAQSRQVFDAIVTRVLAAGGDVNVMADVCQGDQYFPRDVIALSDRERLVDVGAYDGDTIRAFSALTRGRFDRVLAFEIDRNNYSALQEGVRRMPGSSRIETYNLGAWDSECDVSFSIAETQSAIGSGEGRGHVVPLDDVLGDERPTLIKMDIEGAELRALRGARRTIVTHRPKLAVCVYHDFRHLWEIPLYITSLVPDYRIYLRHHTNLEYETVCYAI